MGRELCQIDQLLSEAGRVEHTNSEPKPTLSYSIPECEDTHIQLTFKTHSYFFHFIRNVEFFP